MMSEEKTIAKGSFWVLFSSLMTKLISFIYTIIIVRLVVAEQVGAFYLALSILGILYIFTDLGMIHSLVRYVPYLYGKGEFGRLGRLVKLSYLGGGTLTFVFSIFVFILSEQISQLVGQPEIAPILQMMSIWLLIKEIDDINRGILAGRKRMRESQTMDIIQNSAKLVITLAAFYALGFNAESLSIGYTLSFLLLLPIGGYYVTKEIKTWKKDETAYSLGEQLELGKEVVTFGIVATTISAMWMIIQHTDKIMLGFLVEDALDNIAIYSIALALANLIMIFPSGITGIFFPVVSELYGSGNYDGMNKTLRIATKWLIVLTIPLTVVMFVFGEQLLELFYGEFYASGAVVLLVFVGGLFIKSIFFTPQIVLSAMRRLDVELKAVAVAAVANIIFNFLFIPLWGINGAAFASLISFVLLDLMIFYYSKKIFNFSFPKESYKPVVAGVLALGLMILLKGTIIAVIDNYVQYVQLGLSQGQLADELAQKIVKFMVFGLLFLFSVLVYFIALLLLKSFGEEEITLLEAGLRKARIPEKYVSWSRSFLEAKWLKIPFLR